MFQMEEMFRRIGETYFTLEEGKTCIEIQEALAFPSSLFKVRSIVEIPSLEINPLYCLPAALPLEETGTIVVPAPSAVTLRAGSAEYSSQELAYLRA